MPHSGPFCELHDRRAAAAGRCSRSAGLAIPLMQGEWRRAIAPPTCRREGGCRARIQFFTCQRPIGGCRDPEHLSHQSAEVPRNNCHFRGVKTSANAAPSSPCSPLLRSRVGRRRLPNRPKVLKRLRLHDGTGAIDGAGSNPWTKLCGGATLYTSLKNRGRPHGFHRGWGLNPRKVNPLFGCGGKPSCSCDADQRRGIPSMISSLTNRRPRLQIGMSKQNFLFNGRSISQVQNRRNHGNCVQQ
jgi:hypothetical protein